MKWLISLILILSFTFGAQLDPVLKKALIKGLTPQELKPDLIKVLYRDGSIRVVPASSAKDLMKDKSVIYMEAPRKLKPLMDVIRASSVAIHGSGNSNISISTKDGQSLRIRNFSTSGVNFSGSCSGSISNLQCSSGTLSLSVSASGEFRLIIISDNREIKPSDVSGGTAYYVGTSASLRGRTGRGVIVAIIDTGINPCHPAFLKPDGTSRILYLYEPKTDLELDQNELNNKISTSQCYYDSSGHGTHVAGIAVGGDPSTPYRGIAPEADIIVIRLLDLTDSEIIKGLDYLVRKYQTLRKPMVVNMSLGGHFGPHDGTSLLSRAIDNAVDAGLVVVVAAGNEGDIPLHSRIDNLSSPQTVNFTTYSSGDVIDGWYSGGNLSLKFCRGSSCMTVSPGSTSSSTLGGCPVYIDNSAVPSPLNGDKEFYIEYWCSGDFSLELTPSGTVNRVDMYFACAFCYSEFLNFVPRDPEGGIAGTVGIPGTSIKAITVGALTSKTVPGPTEVNTKSFTDLGKIAFFSSRGPTRDGRIKPDVVAGGFFVYSASNDGVSYIPNAGTSMASPVVAGISALLLENTQGTAGFLQAYSIRNTLLSNTVTDSSTGATPNNIYGHGKVYLKAGAQSGGAGSVGGGGGGGCSVSGINFHYMVILLMIIGIIAPLRRRMNEII